MDKHSTNNMKGLRKMYANAKPVINPEHQYDRQATFLRIKDLLEERARALSRVQAKERQLQGWKPQTFEDKYVYPHVEDPTPQLPDDFDSEYTPMSGYRPIIQPRANVGQSWSKNKKVVAPARKYVSPVGPERKVFRGQKSIPYSAYSSSYGTYPNHAILSIGNADQGVPRWEIRAVPRDGTMHDTPLKRKVTIDENVHARPRLVVSPKPKPIHDTQRALKSILKKGTTHPEATEHFPPVTPKVPEYSLTSQTSSEELLMVAKENAAKRQAAKAMKVIREKLPVIDKKNLKNTGAPLVTWLKPAFLEYADSEMVALPDAIMDKLKEIYMSSTVTEESSSVYSSSLAID